MKYNSYGISFLLVQILFSFIGVFGQNFISESNRSATYSNYQPKQSGESQHDFSAIQDSNEIKNKKSLGNITSQYNYPDGIEYGNISDSMCCVMVYSILEEDNSFLLRIIQKMVDLRNKLTFEDYIKMEHENGIDSLYEINTFRKGFIEFMLENNSRTK